MKTFATIATLAGSLALTAAAQADTLIAYWNFNDFDTSASNIAADAGNGNIDLTGFGGGVSSFAGSEINALFGDESGGSLSLTGGGTGIPGNGTWIDITFSMSGLQNLDVSWAGRGTGTGFDNNQISYSTDGMSFTDFGDPYDSTHTSFELYEFAFGGLLDDAALVTLRITFDGATGSGGGNNRIDNLQINAMAIPAPGAFAVLGLAGLVGCSRRRRN